MPELTRSRFVKAFLLLVPWHLMISWWVSMDRVSKLQICLIHWGYMHNTLHSHHSPLPLPIDWCTVYAGSMLDLLIWYMQSYTYTVCIYDIYIDAWKLSCSCIDLWFYQFFQFSFSKNDRTSGPFGQSRTSAVSSSTFSGTSRCLHGIVGGGTLGLTDLECWHQYLRANCRASQWKILKRCPEMQVGKLKGRIYKTKHVERSPKHSGSRGTLGAHHSEKGNSYCNYDREGARATKTNACGGASYLLAEREK